MITEEIKDILSKCIVENIEEIENFHIESFVQRPNQCGCIKRNGNWYTYEIDEKNYCTFWGPFNNHGLIGALGMLLSINMTSDKYEFTEEELMIYIHNHFHTFSEIDNYEKQK